MLLHIHNTPLIPSLKLHFDDTVHRKASRAYPRPLTLSVTNFAYINLMARVIGAHKKADVRALVVRKKLRKRIIALGCLNSDPSARDRCIERPGFIVICGAREPLPLPPPRVHDTEAAKERAVIVGFLSRRESRSRSDKSSRHGNDGLSARIHLVMDTHLARAALHALYISWRRIARSKCRSTVAQ